MNVRKAALTVVLVAAAIYFFTSLLLLVTQSGKIRPVELEVLPLSHLRSRALLSLLGNNGMPSNVFPLGLCQGDCDNDSECQGNLVCHQRNRGEEVPGCPGGASDYTSNDYCTRSGIAIKQVGNNGSPANRFPLGLCEGDCDKDSDCGEYLVCYERNSRDLVPGCIGGRSDRSQSDYCVEARGRDQSPGSVQHINIFGNNGIPLARFPLGLCQGDCDNDSECEGSLVCYQRKSREKIPGCSGGENDRSANDFCVQAHFAQPHSTPQRQPTQPPAPARQSSNGNSEISIVGNNRQPANRFPLRVCEGDCDGDSDCQGNLICYQRNTREAVPGCSGGRNDDTASDYCVNPQVVPVKSNGFRLKLYWEKGYTWQEEVVERKWCMRCRNGCKRGNQIEISKCSSSSSTKFEFLQDQSDSIQIKIYQKQLCLKRIGNNIYLAVCNNLESAQRWKSARGDFSGRRFEISPVGRASTCLTQRHHPKHGELMKLESCSTGRKDKTAYWNKY